MERRNTIENYLKIIQTAPNKTSLKKNISPLLSENFYFHNSSSNVKKSSFLNHLFTNQDFYKSSKAKVKMNLTNSTIQFQNQNNSISQSLYLDSNNKISIIQQNNPTQQSGGQGYYYNPGINPVAGQPVVNSYLSCCRPIFNGSLLKGGSKKKEQKGGKRSLIYYLDVADNHLNVLPQYKQYVDWY